MKRAYRRPMLKKLGLFRHLTRFVTCTDDCNLPPLP
jgi:hypothetical protein